MSQTNLQLFEISQRTLSQCFTAQPHPAARPRHFQLEGHPQPFLFLTPEDITRQATQQRLHGPVPTVPAQPLTTLS
ncbi:hypothetical protein DPEC_G00331700 [Dallia pectoralis]|uniref:Uncharacterized protein n=1 Tax=Dallia pectoralis TaxID=75939 RepID=A0ACC2F5V0_DALPE|nr:hypothetical protein DPEC_G00331700 [Dallia pectoralis]